MKKLVKWFFITFTVAVIITPVAEGIACKPAADDQKPEPVSSKEITGGIYAIKDDFVNLYVVRDADSLLVIDAGKSTETVKAEFQKLHLQPEKVKAVLLTHTHYDHTGGIRLFKNAVVYLSEKELNKTTEKNTDTLTIGKNTYPNRFVRFADQQIIQFKNVKIKAIATPGHTMSSTCFLVNGKFLFVGDAFSLNNGKVDIPNKAYSKDMKAAVESFDKINNLKTAVYLFTAHTGFTGNYRNAVNTRLKIE